MYRYLRVELTTDNGPFEEAEDMLKYVARPEENEMAARIKKVNNKS